MELELRRGRGRGDQIHVQKLKEKEDEKYSKITLHQQNYNKIDENVTNKRKVVPVVYYLSRNGQLEHPHFMEVPLSSPQGLFLRDVILRLNLLRGKSMGSLYSWSSKRSYKNGYVWHDLEDNDFIHPVHGGEYVLKGSEIQLETPVSSLTVSKPSLTSSSTNAKSPPHAGESDFPATLTRTRRRNQSWGSIDLHEYKVYKTESTHEFAGKAAADASTQTEEKRRRRNNKLVIQEEPEEEENGQRREKVEELVQQQQQIQSSIELSRDEISPPPSDSSPETLESLLKADGRLILTQSSSPSQGIDNNNPTVGDCPSGRMKASSVFMSLISCGSISFRDCGAATVKGHGLSLISHSKTRLPRGGDQTVDGNHEVMSMMEIENDVSSKFAKMALEDKEYFSGSLIETNKKEEFPSSFMLKRSSSYNADRSSNLKLEVKEEEEVRAKCIPRRGRAQQNTNKKECDPEITCVTINSTHEPNQI